MSGDRERFIAAARAAAWTDEDGRTTLHSFRGSFGADWDLEAVIRTIESARSVEWGPDILGHHLRVIEADGRLVRFDVPEPREAQS